LKNIYKGHALLTYLLLDVLRKTPKSRVVNVAAKAYEFGKMNYSVLEKDLKSREKYSSLLVYADSKMYNIQFTAYL